MIRGDASEFYQLADDLADVSAKAVPALRTGMKAAGDHVAKGWANNARQTAGAHGVHYPESISAEINLGFGGVSVDVGPDSSMLQGGMGPGFEFGSRNQPAHLDGVKALESSGRMIEQAIDSAINPLFP